MRKIAGTILELILKAFGSLPLGWHYANSRVLAFLIGDVLRYRRDTVMINLARSFPEKKYRELISICREFYRHFADLIVETLWFGASSAGRLRKSGIVSIANPEVLNDLFDRSPSVMAMYSHCGNWELFGGIENYAPAPFCINEENTVVVYKKMSSRMWDEILRHFRTAPLKSRKTFEGYVESDDVVRYILRNRSNRKVYNFNTDQNPYKNAVATMQLTFMNQHSYSMTAAASLARKMGLAVVYLAMRIKQRGHYEIEYIPICEDASKMTPEEIMLRYYELLEKDIKEQPANYLWTHRRWKKPPTESADSSAQK